MHMSAAANLLVFTAQKDPRPGARKFLNRTESRAGILRSGGRKERGRIASGGLSTPINGVD